MLLHEIWFFNQVTILHISRKLNSRDMYNFTRLNIWQIQPERTQSLSRKVFEERVPWDEPIDAYDQCLDLPPGRLWTDSLNVYDTSISIS